LYSKIESGVTILNGDDLLVEKFSGELGFPPSFFFKSARALGVPASFHEMYRKPKSVSGKKVLAKVSSELTIRMLCVSKLLDSIELEPELTLPQYDVDDYGNDGAAIARAIRRDWLIPDGPIRNLTGLVEKTGIIVFPGYFSAPKVDGVTVNVSGLPPVIFLNSISPADRTRFSLAHELGHVVMHRQTSATMEKEANAFAAEFLMPEREMRAEFSNRIDMKELARLKRIRRVSMAALLYRASEIGKATRNQADYLWRQMSKYRHEEPESTQFEKETPTTLRSILRLFIEKLGYSTGDLSEAFDLWEGMTKVVLDDVLPKEKKLRLVVG
jgi:Zn-dependent peptidase ImmA (M78 family)